MFQKDWRFVFSPFNTQLTHFAGNTANSQTRIGTWCGARNPRSLTSTGRSLYIEFYANDRNQSPHTGVELQFTVFGKNES